MWSRGPNVQGRGLKKIRVQGPTFETELIEAKDRNVRGQGPRTNFADGIRKNF